MQCQNNLKQIGIAIHVYNDAQNGLPPVVAWASRGSVFTEIYSFIEQTSLHEILTSPTLIEPGLLYRQNNAVEMVGLMSFPTPSAGFYGDWWFSSLSSGLATSFGSVPGYMCPSSRTSASEGYTSWWDYNSIGQGHNGPNSDYAAVIAKKNNAAAHHAHRWNAFCFTPMSDRPGTDDDGNAVDIKFGDYDSPLRVSQPIWGTNPDDKTWREANLTSTLSGPGNDTGDFQYMHGYEPRDQISYWSDGTTNQIVIGEKFIPQFARSLKGSASVDGNRARRWDGSMAHTWTQDSVFNVGRLVMDTRICITEGPKDMRVPERHTDGNLYTPVEANGNYGFGSSHGGGIVNFLIGDGTVKTFTSDVSTYVLYSLAQVSDGESVALP
jgi:hypothetical protein